MSAVNKKEVTADMLFNDSKYLMKNRKMTKVYKKLKHCLALDNKYESECFKKFGFCCFNFQYEEAFIYLSALYEGTLNKKYIIIYFGTQKVRDIFMYLKVKIQRKRKRQSE